VGAGTSRLLASFSGVALVGSFVMAASLRRHRASTTNERANPLQNRASGGGAPRVFPPWQQTAGQV
jgi:hypothetical protein